MTNTNNTIIEATESEIKFPTNGNCKGVKDITANKEYGSITEAAICHGVALCTMSNAIRNKSLCKGHKFVLLKELHENTELLCEENAKANRRADKAWAKAERESVRADKAEAKIAAMESEMAEFRQWKAEQEAKRKAEEKRQSKIAKLENKIRHYDELINRKENEKQQLLDKQMLAVFELEELMNNGKEV